MRLNELSPAPGSRTVRTRATRGASAGRGKTAGRGHKGQNSRSGGGVRLGFEGGQLPLQKRVPTYGFASRISRNTAEVRTSELKLLSGTDVTLASLISAGLVRRDKKRARIFVSGEIDRAYSVSGVAVTKGARAAIEAQRWLNPRLGMVAAAPALAGNQSGLTELRNRLLFVLLALFIYRIGTHISSSRNQSGRVAKPVRSTTRRHP